MSCVVRFVYESCLFVLVACLAVKSVMGIRAKRENVSEAEMETELGNV